MGKKSHIELIARGLLIRQGSVLLCRNRKSGYHFLPGGHIEFAERARDALSREFLEETGLSSTIGPLVLTTEHRFHDGQQIHHELNTVFHVEQLGPESESSPSPTPIPTLEDHIDFVWLDLAALPETDLRPVEIKAWLMADGHTDPAQGPWISGFE